MQHLHRLVALLAHLLLLVEAQAATKKVLVIGDSMGEFSGTALESFCKGITVKNAAAGGTTAVQWTSGDNLDAIESCGDSPDFIWLSVGGNDHLEPQCAATASDLTAKITASINAVKQKAPGVPILMTGYCMPKGIEGEGSGCDTPQKFENLRKAVADAAGADDSVTYVDSIAACGGSTSAWSASKYFQDAIHLNNKGYCKVLTQADVQTALGCEQATYDCENVPCMIPGLDKHCSDPTEGTCVDCCKGGSGGSGTASIAGTVGPLLLLEVLLLSLSLVFS